MKRCTKCAADKPLSEFNEYRRRGRLSVDGWCKQCDRALQRARYRDPVTGKREKAWARAIKKNYGIDGAEFEAMFAEQNGRCAICGTTEFGKHRPAIDHCHLTSAIRGILCVRCNTGIGALNDDPYRLQRAIAYLQGFIGSFMKPEPSE